MAHQGYGKLADQSNSNWNDSSHVQLFNPIWLAALISFFVCHQRVVRLKDRSARAVHQQVWNCIGAENLNVHPIKTVVVEVNESGFQSEVLRSKQPVLVAFSASWSRPCHILDAVFAEVATACAANVKFVKVNADDNPDLSLLYDIQSIPTLLYFVDGIIRAKVVGTASKQAILSKLELVCSGDAESSNDKSNRQ
jgi:thioredoxin 1